MNPGPVEGKGCKESEKREEERGTEEVSPGSGNEKAEGYKDGKHTHLVINDCIGKTGRAEQGIGQGVAEKAGIRKCRRHDKDPQTLCFKAQKPAGQVRERGAHEHNAPRY